MSKKVLEVSFVAKLVLGLGLFCFAEGIGQEINRDSIQLVQQKEVATPKEEKYPQIKFGGVFQGRYLNSFKKDVDVDGLHHSQSSDVKSYSRSSFDIKRMRVSMNAKVTENIEVVALANFADFKSKDLSTRVLENAFARYTVNRYLQFSIGQFRPHFGLEDSYSIALSKTIEYSNSYYLFGANGWMSFQVGAAVTGSVDLGKVPMKYAVSVTNGNGKNKTDGDDGKLYSSRLLFNVDKKNGIQVGLSGGIGEVQKQKVYAMGVEAVGSFSLSNNWTLDIETEAKRGTNQSAFFRSQPENRLGKLEDYLIQSFYVLPNVRYELGKKHLQAIEFSCRYEYLDAESKLNSNPRQTFTPMLSLEVVKRYGVRVQMAMQIDNFKTSIKDNKIYNANLGILQVQCTF